MFGREVRFYPRAGVFEFFAGPEERECGRDRDKCRHSEDEVGEELALQVVRYVSQAFRKRFAELSNRKQGLGVLRIAPGANVFVRGIGMTYLSIVVVVSPRHLVWLSLCGSACGVCSAAQGDGFVCGWAHALWRRYCRFTIVACFVRVQGCTFNIKVWSRVWSTFDHGTKPPTYLGMIWPFPGGLAWRLGGSRACAFQPLWNVTHLQKLGRKSRKHLFITVYGIHLDTDVSIVA
jgi:hypothetical protein